MQVSDENGDTQPLVLFLAKRALLERRGTDRTFLMGLIRQGDPECFPLPSLETDRIRYFAETIVTVDSILEPRGAHYGVRGLMDNYDAEIAVLKKAFRNTVRFVHRDKVQPFASEAFQARARKACDAVFKAEDILVRAGQSG